MNDHSKAKVSNLKFFSR